MKVLLDVGISPRVRLPLEAALAGATVESAVYHDWRTLRNNDLLAEAHRQGFTALVTSDKRLASEQSRLPSHTVDPSDSCRPYRRFPGFPVGCLTW